MISARRGAPPARFVAALLERLRAGEAEFVWVDPAADGGALRRPRRDADVLVAQRPGLAELLPGRSPWSDLEGDYATALSLYRAGKLVPALRALVQLARREPAAGDVAGLSAACVAALGPSPRWAESLLAAAAHPADAYVAGVAAFYAARDRAAPAAAASLYEAARGALERAGAWYAGESRLFMYRAWIEQALGRPAEALRLAGDGLAERDAAPDLLLGRAVWRAGADAAGALEDVSSFVERTTERPDLEVPAASRARAAALLEQLAARHARVP